MLLLEVIILLLFSTLDIFLFYLIFEIILIPFFILISQYGSKEHIIKNIKLPNINNSKTLPTIRINEDYPQLQLTPIHPTPTTLLSTTTPSEGRDNEEEQGIIQQSNENTPHY